MNKTPLCCSLANHDRQKTRTGQTLKTIRESLSLLTNAFPGSERWITCDQSHESEQDICYSYFSPLFMAFVWTGSIFFLSPFVFSAMIFPYLKYLPSQNESGFILTLFKDL